MKAIVALLSVLVCVIRGLAQDPVPMRFVRLDVPWGQPITLERFGGPAIDVSVRSRQISFVTVEIADYTRMIPVLVNDATIYGPSRVVMQPTRETRRVEKKGGTKVPGGRADMYLLYIEPTSGVQVHFSDEASAQNRDVLFVGVPTAAAQRESMPEEPAATPSAAANAARPADGYLSDKLLDWYLRLEEKRDRLDPKDTDAVQRFNEEAARYHAEVKRARAFGAQ